MRGKEVLMMKNARKIIKTCATVKTGEKVLIVTDPIRINIAYLLTGVLAEENIKPVITIMFPNELDGQEPPEIIARAMLEADVIIMPVGPSISHSLAVHEALDNGARVLALSALVEEQMYLGGIHADFDKQRPECDRFAGYFTKSEQIRITTPAGTDFTASIKGRKGNSHPCIVDQPGAYSSMPNIEANISPVENTAEGILIIDGAVSNFGIGVVKTPIKMTVRSGVIQNISGGKEAKYLANLLESLDDSAVLNIAQIAIGLNPQINDFNGLMLNDHGVYGSTHIGIGTSHNLGGEVKAPIHYDVMMANPTVSFDGNTVIKDGNVLG